MNNNYTVTIFFIGWIVYQICLMLCMEFHEIYLIRIVSQDTNLH